jgi:hypothetical protein
VLPYIHRLRNAECARLALESARKQYEAARAREVGTLRRRREELGEQLARRKGEDLQQVLQAFLERAARARPGSEGEFPLEAWMQLAPQLSRFAAGRPPFFFPPPLSLRKIPGARTGVRPSPRLPVEAP